MRWAVCSCIFLAVCFGAAGFITGRIFGWKIGWDQNEKLAKAGYEWRDKQNQEVQERLDRARAELNEWRAKHFEQLEALRAELRKRPPLRMPPAME